MKTREEKTKQELKFSSEIQPFPEDISSLPASLNRLQCLLDVKLYSSKKHGILIGIDYYSSSHFAELKGLHQLLQSFGQTNEEVSFFSNATSFFQEFLPQDRIFNHTTITHSIKAVNIVNHIKISIVYQLPATVHGACCWLSNFIYFIPCYQKFGNTETRFINYDQDDIFSLENFIDGSPQAFSLLDEKKRKKKAKTSTQTQAPSIQLQLINAIIELKNKHRVTDPDYLYAINAVNKILNKWGTIDYHELFSCYLYINKRFQILYPETYIPETCTEKVMQKIVLNLLIHREMHYVDYFVGHIMRAGKKEEIKKQNLTLYELARGMTADDNVPYGDSHTEKGFVAAAEFKLIEDRLHIVNLNNNFGYQNWYAPGRQNELLFAREIKHFYQQSLGFEIADDSDFKKKIIFTEEGTKKLIEYLPVNTRSLHQIIVEGYLRYLAYIIFPYENLKPGQQSPNLFSTLPTDVMNIIINYFIAPYQIDAKTEFFDPLQKLKQSIATIDRHVATIEDPEWSTVTEEKINDTELNGGDWTLIYSDPQSHHPKNNSRSHEKTYVWINIQLKTPQPDGTSSFYVRALIGKNHTINAQELQTRLKNQAGKDIKFDDMRWSYTVGSQTNTVNCSEDFVIHDSHFKRNFLIMSLEKKPNLTTTATTITTTTTIPPMVSNLSFLNNVIVPISYSVYFEHYANGREDKHSDKLLSEEWKPYNALREHILKALVQIGLDDRMDIIKKQQTALFVIQQHENQLSEFNFTAIRMLRDQIKELASADSVVQVRPQFKNGPVKYLRAHIDEKTGKVTSHSHKSKYYKMIMEDIFEKLENKYSNTVLQKKS